MPYVPCRKAVRHYGVDKTTLARWCARGLLEYTTTPGGQKRYAVPQDPANVQDKPSCAAPRKVSYCYCRVSSPKQRDDLARQEQAMRDTYPNHVIVSDIGSGINFKRRGLRTILEQSMHGKVAEVVVAHRDRLARFATELIEWQLRTCGAKLVVQHQGMGTPEAELVEDLLSIVTVFACRSNGRRRYKTAVKEEDADVQG